jgi:imidazolonepropionase-like amidohydrolase
MTLVFQHAFLIDGTGGEPVADATVVVADQTIREINPGRARQPKGRVIDLKGRTLMPGLIDAHVHPGNVEWYLRDTVRLPPAVYVHRVTRTLETDLALGFTTLRDAAGLDQGFREAVDQKLIRGPRLFLSVTPLLSYDPDARPGPRNSLGVSPEVCNGPDDMRAAVKRTLAVGADQIKLFADGEVVSQSKADRAKPGDPKFSIAEIEAAVGEAAAGGAYVMAHAYCPEAIRNCAKAGVRSIEHGNLMDEDAARLMADRGVFYVPTLTTYDVFAQQKGGNLDAATREKMAIVGDKGREALETAWRAGVKIGSGSDIIGPMQHLKARELMIKAEILSPMQAIVSATRTNAELLGVESTLGTLKPGKTADLIVLDGNPLEDISLFENALENVVLVMKAGIVCKDRLAH